LRRPFNKGFYIAAIAMKVRSDREALYDSKVLFFLRNVVQLMLRGLTNRYRNELQHLQG